MIHGKPGFLLVELIMCSLSAPGLVILDLKPPRVNGPEVLRRAECEERLAALPVIILSSSNNGRDLRERYRLGANSYIQKPPDLQEFREAMRAFALYRLGINHLPPASTFERAVSGENE